VLALTSGCWIFLTTSLAFRRLALVDVDCSTVFFVLFVFVICLGKKDHAQMAAVTKSVRVQQEGSHDTAALRSD
jgi:hypothetical protein